MPRRLFDFECKNSHVTESFVDVDTKEVQCVECGETATRIISPVGIALDPVCGDFPSATSKWMKSRHERIQKEKRDKANHGS